MLSSSNSSTPPVICLRTMSRFRREYTIDLPSGDQTGKVPLKPKVNLLMDPLAESSSQMSLC